MSSLLVVKVLHSIQFCCLNDVVQILTPFMLRRLKVDVDFVIPPKREVVVYAQLSAVQQEMYRCILDKTIQQLVKAPSSETPVCQPSPCYRWCICCSIYHSLESAC